MPKYKIYYARKPTFHPSGKYGVPPLTIEGMAETHVFVREVKAGSLGEAMWSNQAEAWSPNGKADPLIRRLGLRHTSMSVGDVAQDPFGAYWEATGYGWRAVKHKHTS